MAHGAPDYGRGAPKATVYSLQDMAELAVRLGSIVTYDRRGDVVFLDGFEQDYKKWEGTVGIDFGSVATSGDMARNGQMAAHFITGAIDGGVTGIVKYLPYPALGRHGVEVSFTDSTGLTYITVQVVLNDGTTTMVFAVRWDVANERLQVFDSGGGWTTFATGTGRYRLYTIFLTLKLVVDLEAGKYVRCLFNETEYDLSVYSRPAPASALPAMLRLTLTTVSAGTPAVESYMDDVIVTQNEP